MGVRTVVRTLRHGWIVYQIAAIERHCRLLPFDGLLLPSMVYLSIYLFIYSFYFILFYWLRNLAFLFLASMEVCRFIFIITLIVYLFINVFIYLLVIYSRISLILSLL